MQTTATDDDDTDEREGDFMRSHQDEQRKLSKGQGTATTWYTLRKESPWYP